MNIKTIFKTAIRNIKMETSISPEGKIFHNLEEIKDLPRMPEKVALYE